MLVSKRCASADVPPDRFNIEAHYNPDTKRLDTLSCRGGHYIDGKAGTVTHIATQDLDILTG